MLIIRALIISLFLSAPALASDGKQVFLKASDSEASSFLEDLDYYRQFFYEVQGDCSDIDKLWFAGAMSWFSGLMGNDDKGRPAYVVVDIAIFDDGTYWAEYIEQAISDDQPPHLQYERLFTKELEGTWKVVDNRIIFSDLGVGLPGEHIDGNDTYPTIQLALKTVHNDPRALHPELKVLRTFSNVGARGVSRNEYCGIN